MSEAPSPRIHEVESRILEFIRHELVAEGVAIGRDDDLLSGELLDSVAVLRLATFVDEAFRIGMQPTDFLIENFQTAAVLAEFVVRRSTDAGASNPIE